MPRSSSVIEPLPCSSSNIPIASSIGDMSTTTRFPTKLNNLSTFNRTRTASKDLPRESVKRKSGTMKGRKKQLNNLKNIKNATTIPETVGKQNHPKNESFLSSSVDTNYFQRDSIIHEALPVTSSSIIHNQIMPEHLVNSTTGSSKTITASNKSSAEESKVPSLNTSGEQNDEVNGKNELTGLPYEELTDEQILQLMRSSIQTFETLELEQLDAEELESS